MRIFQWSTVLWSAVNLHSKARGRAHAETPNMPRRWKITRSHNIYMTRFNVYIPGTTMFAHSSCTSLFIVLFIKSTVYCIAHIISLHILPLIFFLLFLFYLYLYLYIFSCVSFLFSFFLHGPLSGPVLIYISPLIIPCIIEYVTNKRNLR